MSSVAVVGTGYVGLTTGAYLAHLGHSVVCADVVPEKIEMLGRGEIPIFEAGLEDLVREGLEGGRLRFVLGAARAVVGAEFTFLCVPTPQGQDGSADMSHIEAAAAEIGPALAPESVVVNKSTVPVGSTRVVEAALGRSDVFVVSNPEFLREGSAVHDCLHPDRIVIGADDQAAAGRVASLFENLQAPLIVTDPASAETIKYASNAFLATKISFVNAVANLCEAVGADVREVVLGMGYDKRIGFEFLKPGPGFGGSCLLGQETVLARRGPFIELVSLGDLFERVEQMGPNGWEVLSWRDGDAAPAFLPVLIFTQRPYVGDVIEVRTKMGRRITVTADHPFVVGDGRSSAPTERKLAEGLTTEDWLPIAQGAEEPTPSVLVLDVLDALEPSGIQSREVIARLDERLRRELAGWLLEERAAPVRAMLRSNTARLHELERRRIDASGASLSTVTNGTYVPAELVAGADFWRMIGLYLAEGHICADGGRRRISWSFNLVGEEDLALAVTDFWRRNGVKTTTRPSATALQVSISSRILAGWFTHSLGVGDNCYNHGVPDAIWDRPAEEKRALLRGLWDGDGSWSLVAGGPSVVLEYGTVSRALADGMVRLLGDLRITARLKVGRTSKSTVDTYWISVSGADQIEDALWLFPAEEAAEILAHLGRQAKRIRPTGYRPLAKNASWARVTTLTRRPFCGDVYSVEVPGAHTIVSSFGLVVSNCFPKDTRALVRIGEDAGYDFSLLKGVIAVNLEQHERVVAKVVRHAGGDLREVPVAVWGLSFKARTDDLRDSPSVEVCRRLAERGAVITAYDPTVTRDLPGLTTTRDPYAATEGAAVLVVLTEWDEFRWVDFHKVKELMAEPRVVDARNLLDPAAMRRWGFTYEGMGRA